MQRSRFGCYHRILDARRRERHVLLAGNTRCDPGGSSVQLHGFVADLTAVRREDLEPAIDDAIGEMLVNRATIEQAKGAIMLAYGVTPDAAFEVLRTASQAGNTKLHELAERLVTMLAVEVRLSVDHAALDRMLAEATWPVPVAPVAEAVRSRNRPVRVALWNDYEVALLGLTQMLARHPDQVTIVDLTTLPQVPPGADVILFDTFGHLPDRDERLRKIAREHEAKVVVYSSARYPEADARRVGAVRCLHKSLGADALVAAILAIHDGEPPAEVASVEEPIVTWPGQDLGLSYRESEVLTLITRGLTNQEMAHQTYLSPNTVKTYIRSAYRKVGVNNRAQAVAWGYQNGFQGNTSLKV